MVNVIVDSQWFRTDIKALNVSVHIRVTKYKIRMNLHLIKPVYSKNTNPYTQSEFLHLKIMYHMDASKWVGSLNQ